MRASIVPWTKFQNWPQITEDTLDNELRAMVKDLIRQLEMMHPSSDEPRKTAESIAAKLLELEREDDHSIDFYVALVFFTDTFIGVKPMSYILRAYANVLERAREYLATE